MVAIYTYNPFGETITEQGEFYTPWKFTGQFLDSETGQYYLRARQYSPYLARFTSYDPVMGKFEEPLTLHKYLYCGNDPVNRFDPFGRDYIDVGYTYTHYGAATGGVAGFLHGLSYGPLGAIGGTVFGAAIGGLGVTGGAMYDFDTKQTHLYLGLSWSSSLGKSMVTTTSFSKSNVQSGWNIAGSFSKGGMYAQWGSTYNSQTHSWSTYQEYGFSSARGFGYSGSVFYVFKGLGNNKKMEDLDLLDKAIMLADMHNETAVMLRDKQAGIGMYSLESMMAYELLEK